MSYIKKGKMTPRVECETQRAECTATRDFEIAWDLWVLCSFIRLVRCGHKRRQKRGLGKTKFSILSGPREGRHMQEVGNMENQESQLIRRWGAKKE